MNGQSKAIDGNDERKSVFQHTANEKRVSANSTELQEELEACLSGGQQYRLKTEHSERVLDHFVKAFKSGDSLGNALRQSATAGESMPVFSQAVFDAYRKVHLERYLDNDKQRGKYLSKLLLVIISESKKQSPDLERLRGALAEAEQVPQMNQYSPSPLSFRGTSYISPSMVLAASGLVLNEQSMSEVLAGHRFTTQDIGQAILLNYSVNKFSLLLARVDNISVSPLLVGNHGFPPLTVADIAAWKGKLAILQHLINEGIYPSDIPGIVTSLDVALLGAEPLKSNQQVTISPNRRAMIQYLVNRGGRAHIESHSAVDDVQLRIGSIFQEQAHINGDLAKQIDNLIPATNRLTIKKADEYLESESAENQVFYEQLKEEWNSFTRNETECRSKLKKLYKLHKAVPPTEYVAYVSQAAELSVDAESLIYRLHGIDPLLVEFVRPQLPLPEYLRRDSGLQRILTSSNLEEVITHVGRHSLSALESELLLRRAIEDTKYIDAFEVRLERTPPRSIMFMTQLSKEKWHSLFKAGLSADLVDALGRDLYQIAMESASPQEKIDLLKSIGAIPYNSQYGLDALDVTLDKSYNQRKWVLTVEDVAFLIQQFSPLSKNHESRLLRIKTFYPDLFSELESEAGTIPLDEKVGINLFIRDPMEK